MHVRSLIRCATVTGQAEAAHTQSKLSVVRVFLKPPAMSTVMITSAQSKPWSIKSLPRAELPLLALLSHFSAYQSRSSSFEKNKPRSRRSGHNNSSVHIRALPQVPPSQKKNRKPPEKSHVYTSVAGACAPTCPLLFPFLLSSRLCRAASGAAP